MTDSGSAGCSTGEEAYSLAILLQEYMESTRQGFTVQLFATDLDPHAIAVARSGVYPSSIAADVAGERLARFFTVDSKGADGEVLSYRINKNIRDMLIFSEQNLIKDPPFSRLDLISCRNLMIYLSADLQKKLIPLFHYALDPDGFLFLGTSESVGEYADLFQPIDRRLKLYRRKEAAPKGLRLPVGDYFPPAHNKDTSTARAVARKAVRAGVSLRELAEQTLLRQIAPSGALVNGQGDILYLTGRTGTYLEPAVGEVGGGYNIVKMAREGLRNELASALRKAAQSKAIVRCRNLAVKADGQVFPVNLTVCQAVGAAAGGPIEPLYLVVLEEGQAMGHEGGSLAFDGGAEQGALVARLREELRAKEEYLQAANEDLETFNEELKSSNEEMQSVNEEMQSTNEELVTSKEELQSMNEELATVNNELTIKVADLSRANNDMNNLLAGTGIATIFVDHRLRIMRFTPSASALINVIKGDVGRPVNHILTNLSGYEGLESDILSVLETLIPRSIEVQSVKGEWFRMNILPYRTIDNVIEGAVITFVDINERKQIEEELRRSEEKLRSMIGNISDVIGILDSKGVMKYCSPGVEKLSGWLPEDMIGGDGWSAVHPDDLGRVQEAFAALLREENATATIEFRCQCKDGGCKTVEAAVTNLLSDPIINGVLINYHDVTERKRAETTIKALLSAKETLIKEVNHRVKNNIATIESLLALQIRSSSDAGVKSALQDAVARVQSMRVLYDKLLIDTADQKLSAKSYVESLVDSIAVVFPDSANIVIDKRIDDFKLDVKTMTTLGIIINELLTNIFKYAFPEGNGGLREAARVGVSLEKDASRIALTIEDNGKGLSESLTEDAGTGFGLTIVKMLVEQLHGDFTVESDNGVRSRLVFPDKA